MSREHKISDDSEHPHELSLAAQAGDCERLRELMRDTSIDINWRNDEGFTALQIAALHGHLDACKLLAANGLAIDSGYSSNNTPFALALRHKHYAVAKWLDDYAIHIARAHKSKAIQHKPLMQGPSRKNRALRDVEYVFHCLIGARFNATAADGDRYNHSDMTREREFTLRKEANMLLADCPNGKTYNVSLALKHANLEYFRLPAMDPSIVEQCEDILGHSREHKLADQLRSGIGRHSSSSPTPGSEDEPDDTHTLICSAIEQQAVRYYTGSGSHHINPLLRGQPIVETENSHDKLGRLFLNSLLTVSGINKNVHLDQRDANKTLIRHEGKLPDVLIAEMKLENHLVHRCGMQSYSRKGVFTRHQNRIILNNSNLSQGSIAHISSYSREDEVCFPPLTKRFTDYRYNSKTGKYEFHADIVQGVASEFNDHYLLRQASTFAYNILKHPYKVSPNPRFGINRHNHALAHHIRACSYVEDVIGYFSHHAAEEGFRTFCNDLTPEELSIMQVMMLLSKTGRESEASPHQACYMDYQHQSVAHLQQFMREHMHCDEATIEFYSEIMLNMGNPAYPELVSGESETVKQRKLYINHITAFAHKLDLIRVYGSSSYKRSISGYDGSAQHGTGLRFVESSDAQQKQLKQLETLARSCLKKTGDKVMFGDESVAPCAYNEDIFKRCNSDIDHCWQQCLLAKADVKQSEYSKKSSAIESVRNAIMLDNETLVLERLGKLKISDITNNWSCESLLETAVTHATHKSKLGIITLLMQLLPHKQACTQIWQLACKHNNQVLLNHLFENRHEYALDAVNTIPYFTQAKHIHFMEKIVAKLVQAPIILTRDIDILMSCLMLAHEWRAEDITKTICDHEPIPKRLLHATTPQEAHIAWLHALRHKDNGLLEQLHENRHHNGLDINTALLALASTDFKLPIKQRILREATRQSELHCPGLIKLLGNHLKNCDGISAAAMKLLLRHELLESNFIDKRPLAHAIISNPHLNQRSVKLLSLLCDYDRNIHLEAITTLMRRRPKMLAQPNQLELQILTRLLKNFADYLATQSASCITNDTMLIIKQVILHEQEPSHLVMDLLQSCGITPYPEQAAHSIGNHPSTYSDRSLDALANWIRHAPSGYLDKTVTDGHTLAAVLLKKHAGGPICQAIIDTGFDTSTLLPEGINCLHLAVRNCSLEQSLQLLECCDGRDWLNLSNSNNMTPMAYLIAQMDNRGKTLTQTQHQKLADAFRELDSAQQVAIIKKLSNKIQQRGLASLPCIKQLLPCLTPDASLQLCDFFTQSPTLLCNFHVLQNSLNPSFRRTHIIDTILDTASSGKLSQLLDALLSCPKQSFTCYAERDHIDLFQRVFMRLIHVDEDAALHSQFCHHLESKSTQRSSALSRYIDTALTRMLLNCTSGNALTHNAITFFSEYLFKRMHEHGAASVILPTQRARLSALIVFKLRLSHPGLNQDELRFIQEQLENLLIFLKHHTYISNDTIERFMRFLLAPTQNSLPTLRRLSAMMDYHRRSDNAGLKTVALDDIRAIVTDSHPNSLSEKLFQKHMLDHKYSHWPPTKLFAKDSPAIWTQRYRSAHSHVLSQLDNDAASQTGHLESKPEPAL